MNEANLRGLLTEAASAKEEIILSNETTAVATSTAIQILVQNNNKSKKLTKHENRDHIHEGECNQDWACFYKK